MPKKIIERTIIDEDDSLDGSENEYTEVEQEPKPQPKQQLKQQLKQLPKPKSKSKKERTLEEEMQIEENKKNRVVNATKARLAKLEENRINNAVNQKLLEEKRKIREHKEMQKKFELSVETVVDRIMKMKFQPEEQTFDKKNVAKQNKLRKLKPVKQVKDKIEYEPEYQEQHQPQYIPQQYPNYQQSQPQHYPNNDSINNFRNLFM